MSRLGRAGAAAAAASVAALAWGTLVERHAYVLRRVTVPVLPAGSPELRVLHLSDLHMAPWQHDKQRWVRELAAHEPDLVIDTGDNLGHADGVLGVGAALEAFRGVPGAYVWGSNDYFGPVPKNPFGYFRGPSKRVPDPRQLDIESLGTYLDGLGWRSLNNTAARLTVRGVELELFGVDDPHRHFDRLEDMVAARDGLSGTDAPAVRLGVAHAPYRRVLDAFVAGGADVVFAGHTHGGQVCVPGFGALVTNCDLPRLQVKGLSRWRAAGREAWLHVSAGLGTSIYAPVRFACPPEATLLTLTPM